MKIHTLPSALVLFFLRPLVFRPSAGVRAAPRGSFGETSNAHEEHADDRPRHLGMMMMGSTSGKGSKSSMSNKSSKKSRSGVEAVTAWWLFANNPSACISNPNTDGLPQCGPRDVYGDDYLASLAQGDIRLDLLSPNLDAELGIVFATGGTTDEYGYIRMVASAYLTQDPLDIDVSIDPLRFQRGYISTDAEVSIVVKRHGPFYGFMEQYTELLDPYCDDPIIGWEGPLNEMNTICLESQFASWAAGVDGESPLLLTFTDMPAPLQSNSGPNKAYLNRRGDALQAIVETDVTIFNSPF